MCELWIHTCWGNPNMQRVMEDTSYANSIEIYLERCRGDVWTLEMKDRNQRDLELFAPFRNDLKKKICIGAVSHRTLQADRPEDVAGEIRKALVHIPAEQLIVSSDCGFGARGATARSPSTRPAPSRKAATSCARELGLPTTYIPATDPQLQIDVVERQPTLKRAATAVGRGFSPAIDSAGTATRELQCFKPIRIELLVHGSIF